jgi:AhpD family alkylhydroperoxidase
VEHQGTEEDHTVSGQIDSRISERTFKTEAAGVYRAMIALGQAVDAGGLDKGMIELVKIRASQINDCGYCVQYHLNLARRLGMAPARLDLLAVWREVGVYSERERAALAWTEALSRMGADEVTDEDFAAAAKVFSVNELSYLTGAIATINAWNRIAGALRFAAPVPAENLRETVAV